MKAMKKDSMKESRGKKENRPEDAGEECYDFGGHKVCNVCDFKTGRCELHEKKPLPAKREDEKQ